MLAEYISTWMTLPISNIVDAVVHCQFLSFNNKLVENIFGDKKSGTRITFSTKCTAYQCSNKETQIQLEDEK